jgi:predicted transcriptional regulator
MITMTSVPFSFRLDESLKKRLEQEAQSQERSASYVAVKAIEQFLYAKDVKNLAIEEAVKEADQGIFVSSQAVNNWMESWGSEEELSAPEPDILPTKS